MTNGSDVMAALKKRIESDGILSTDNYDQRMATSGTNTAEENAMAINALLRRIRLDNEPKRDRLKDTPRFRYLYDRYSKRVPHLLKQIREQLLDQGESDLANSNYGPLSVLLNKSEYKKDFEDFVHKNNITNSMRIQEKIASSENAEADALSSPLFAFIEKLARGRDNVLEEILGNFYPSATLKGQE